MALKRVVDTRFWTDDKIIELFSPEDKLFMLYLLTNPHTTQLGIYKINKKIMSFELGYSLETIQVLLERFETKYKIILYCDETNEIAIKNYLKYSVIKGGKPVEDCLLKEIKQVKNKQLINYVFNNIKNDTNINETINKIINIYINEIYNDNDNEVSYHDTCNDTKKNIYGEFKNVKLKDEEYQKLKERGLTTYIESLSCYLENHPKKKYASHYATILTWSRKENKNNGNEILDKFDKNNKIQNTTKEDIEELESILKEIGE